MELNWLAIFIYILAAVEAHMLLILAEKAGVKVPIAAVPRFAMVLLWPLAPVMYLYKVATSK